MTEYVDLIEPGCAPHETRIKISWRTSSAQLFRSSFSQGLQKNAYYGALLLSNTKAAIQGFYDKEVELSLLIGVRRSQGRRGQWDWSRVSSCIPCQYQSIAPSA